MDRRLHIATKEIIDKVHAYMRAHPESELHQCGKMFGVLLYEGGYLAAFSAKLDGTYYHEGFVPPVYAMTQESIGTSREESRRLQRLLFAKYNFVNGKGEYKNLLEIFANEKPIVPAEEWFGKELKNERVKELKSERIPPSGAGECCAPKLLQYALTHGMKPLALAEFWVGAPSKTEIRQEGQFYAPCSGRCVPILRHVTQGLDDLEIYDFLTHKGYDYFKFKISNFQKPEILYEDEWLMVVNKPAGMLSVPGKTEKLSVESYFRLKNEDLRFLKAVHRLDQDTSGLLVLAKTAEVYKELQAYFQRRDILKRYEAVLRPNGDASLNDANDANDANDGMIELPLLPNPYDRPRQMVDREHGKVAITRYQIRERRADGTLFVDFYPLTGRTHQLRVHAAHPDGLNAPIVGDRLYNGELINGDASLNDANDESRLMLHAAEIRFMHPVTQQEMHFCLPTPEIFGCFR